MKTKHIFLCVLMLLCLSSCATSFHAAWSGSTYDPLQHTFETDSATLAKRYGVVETDEGIRLRVTKGRIIDSIPYFYFRLVQTESFIPIIPIFYHIEFQKPNALYELDVTVYNYEIYQSFDSIRYTLYDSLGTKCYKGKYVYDWKFAKSPGYPESSEPRPYSIDFKLCENDIIYGDIEMFFTDFNNKFIVQSIKKIKFDYKKSRRWFYYFLNY